MLLTLDELAKYLKVHPNTIHNWLKIGLPCFRRGFVIRFNLERVLEWLERKENYEK